LPESRQAELRKRFEAVVERAYPTGDAPAWQLTFHESEILGANAFALPGGHIVMTDELIELLKDQPDAIQGVLAHELAHVQHSDGMDMMVRASLVSALVGVVLGDASGFIATVPATLATQSYSRDAERRADAHAASMLHAAGLSPSAMAVFFERMQEEDRGDEKGKANKDKDKDKEGVALPIAISSHPDHGERIEFFRAWQPPAQP
jgi:Zn-dependent protease with chaperone function